MADKSILRPPGSLETKLSTSVDSTTSDSSHPERADFFSGVRKGFKKLGGSISAAQRPIHHSSAIERSNSSLDAPLTSGADRQAAIKKGHTRSTSDLGKPLPATPISPTIDQLLRASCSPPYTPNPVSAPISTPASTSVPTSASTSFSTTASIVSRPPLNGSRTSTMDSNTSAASGIYTGHKSTSALNEMIRSDGGDERKDDSTSFRNNNLQSLSSQKSRSLGTKNGPAPPPGASSQHLSGLMCNVHRTTGRIPPPLVGATTTILGDKLYVFGGRVLSRSRPVLTADLYELDLIRRNWLRLEFNGEVPPPRYFHSVCALGDSKLVCFGGMSPAPSQAQTQGVPVSHNLDTQAEVVVMSDIYIYDTPQRKWSFIPCPESPQGRYAHCTTILPSSAVSSSAISHSTSLSPQFDGTGGAEMVVVGGQDSTNHYIEQISIFNFRSMKWTSTQQLGKSCGAYRSVVAPLSSKVLSNLGKSSPLTPKSEETDVEGNSLDRKESGSSMLIYSNYNFLDVKLELQIRNVDGTLVEKPMQGNFSPPGLRFPNGGVIGTNFVVSGTYLTSSKQEYAIWALDLRTLTWSRIDAGGAVFSQGSWNRGVLWSRRNTFVILGNRKRSLVEDYNHRRINFNNVCMVELEAFGFYDNPRRISPMSGFISASSPLPPNLMKQFLKNGWTPGGCTLSTAAEELGQAALGLRHLADMEIICINGDRVPVNSRIIAKRWGPYFIRLLREGTTTTLDTSDAATLRPSESTHRGIHRDSSVTITSNLDQMSIKTKNSNRLSSDICAFINPPDVTSLPPTPRPRILFLPHTKLTVQALLYFLYTSALPPSTSPLCTPQILCSLLQIARPYQIDGLLESVVERLHSILDSRNAAAVFNASAMAAGGCSTLSLIQDYYADCESDSSHHSHNNSDVALNTSNGLKPPKLKINTSLGPMGRCYEEDEPTSATESVCSDMSYSDHSINESVGRNNRFLWNGGVSAVIGLQKRGLRGLMEGRRLRERGPSNSIDTRDT